MGACPRLHWTMLRARRSAVLALAVSGALLLSACGAEEPSALPEATPTSAGTPEPETEDPAPPGEAAEAEEPAFDAPAIDGPPAPDFTLALADGGEFTLSAERRAVYVIFWAEW